LLLKPVFFDPDPDPDFDLDGQLEEGYIEESRKSASLQRLFDY
jgi:hypothetical protein